MSAEHKTVITRPDIFPECETCSIVNKIIYNWLNPDNSPPVVSKKVLSVTIKCKVKNGHVQMLHNSKLAIQLKVGEKPLPVDGGNLNPEDVKCPHFSEKGSEMPDPDPE